MHIKNQHTLQTAIPVAWAALILIGVLVVLLGASGKIRFITLYYILVKMTVREPFK